MTVDFRSYAALKPEASARIFQRLHFVMPYRDGEHGTAVDERRQLLLKAVETGIFISYVDGQLQRMEIARGGFGTETELTETPLVEKKIIKNF